MSAFGISGMVRSAAWLEIEFDLMTIFIGRRGLDRRDSCTLEICGAHLLYVVELDGGWIWVRASLMDSGNEPELLLREGDTAAGWAVVTRLIASMEHNAVRSLSRPIEVGYGEGPENWIIF